MRNVRMEYIEIPKWYTRQQALEMALEHVRNYHDRCYLQFLISMEKRNEL